MKAMLSPASLLLLLLLAFSPANCDISGGPDLGVQAHTDPENPDFSGVVDFSNAVPGPDGSWCITKVKYVDHMESDQVKECWHQNVTQCHDTYITEFLPSQEQKCEESFWKSCKIDFKEMPFNYTLKQCHTPLVKDCEDGSQPSYGAPPQTVCRTWFESECNTTYVEAPSGLRKPNTWCQKKPRKICAPDNCKMKQGAEICHDQTMVSTIQKPEEHCELQPQKHCRLVTRLVPHLTTREVCKAIPKEICVLKLVNPHPVKKPIQLKWCTKKKQQVAQQPTYRPPPTSYLPSPSNYLPPQSSDSLPFQQGPPQVPPPPPSYDSFQPVKRSKVTSSNDQFIITVDGEKFAELNQLPSGLPLPKQQFRQVREQGEEPKRPVRQFRRQSGPQLRKRHSQPVSHMQTDMDSSFSSSSTVISKEPKQPRPTGNTITSGDKSTQQQTSPSSPSSTASAPISSSSSSSSTSGSSLPPRPPTQQTFTTSSLRNYPGSIL